MEGCKLGTDNESIVWTKAKATPDYGGHGSAACHWQTRQMESPPTDLDAAVEALEASPLKSWAATMVEDDREADLGVGLVAKHGPS